MPKVAGRTKYPKGWEIIEPTLTELEVKMREAESDPQEGKRKEEAVWPIARINHERSRYIYEMFYKKKKISRELYNFCLKNGYADANLIAKWKKNGYERLCCLACIQRDGTNYGNTCICRVPRSDLPKGKVVECVNCGCHGCASGDI